MSRPITFSIIIPVFNESAVIPELWHRLAEVLKLPASQLLVLSGNVGIPNEKLYKAALQFAARVHEAGKLNSEQSKALHDFVQALMEAA